MLSQDSNKNMCWFFQVGIPPTNRKPGLEVCPWLMLSSGSAWYKGKKWEHDGMQRVEAATWRPGWARWNLPSFKEAHLFQQQDGALKTLFSYLILTQRTMWQCSQYVEGECHEEGVYSSSPGLRMVLRTQCDEAVVSWADPESSVDNRGCRTPGKMMEYCRENPPRKRGWRWDKGSFSLDSPSLRLLKYQ